MNGIVLRNTHSDVGVFCYFLLCSAVLVIVLRKITKYLPRLTQILIDTVLVQFLYPIKNELSAFMYYYKHVICGHELNHSFGLLPRDNQHRFTV